MQQVPGWTISWIPQCQGTIENPPQDAVLDLFVPAMTGVPRRAGGRKPYRQPKGLQDHVLRRSRRSGIAFSPAAAGRSDQHTEGNRFAVANRPVTGKGLDGVPVSAPKIQNRPERALFFVTFCNIGLDLARPLYQGDRPSGLAMTAWRSRASPEEIFVGNHAVFYDLGQPGGEFPLWQGLQVATSMCTSCGLVKAPIRSFPERMVVPVSPARSCRPGPSSVLGTWTKGTPRR